MLWSGLLAAAAWVIVVQFRSLWRKSVALVRELSLAAERLDVLDQELATLAERSPTLEDLAIFADPRELRRARFAAHGGRSHNPSQPRHRAAVVRPTEPGRAVVR